jgi:hypothetical protein
LRAFVPERDQPVRPDPPEAPDSSDNTSDSATERDEPAPKHRKTAHRTSTISEKQRLQLKNAVNKILRYKRFATRADMRHVVRRLRIAKQDRDEAVTTMMASARADRSELFRRCFALALAGATVDTLTTDALNKIWSRQLSNASKHQDVVSVTRRIFTVAAQQQASAAPGHVTTVGQCVSLLKELDEDQLPDRVWQDS